MRLYSDSLQLPAIGVSYVVTGETDRQITWLHHQRYVAIRTLRRRSDERHVSRGFEKQARVFCPAEARNFSIFIGPEVPGAYVSSSTSGCFLAIVNSLRAASPGAREPCSHA